MEALTKTLSIKLNSSKVNFKFITTVNQSIYSRKSGIVLQSSIPITNLFINQSEFPLEIIDYPQTEFKISQIYISNADISMGYLINDHLFLSGLPEIRDLISEDNWRQKFSDNVANGTKLIKISASAFLIILPDNIAADQFNQTYNVTSLSVNAHLSKCVLIMDTSLVTILSEISTSRFQDNEEFKYSLRSLDKFVDFYRHIFIVTNGQVPSWLDTNHPKITVVPHNSIFRNKSHLPTFNSAAIEANLINIPGLAPHFIYLNDDVFFGKKIYPEDFHSPSSGYKIYLGWSVPNCVEACPSSWLADGFCDHECNVAECQWDGGDCLKTHGNFGMVHFGKNVNSSFPQNDNFNNLLQGIVNEFCSVGCNSNWLGDRYCDQACNVDRCGYDLGDCGDANIFKLPSAVITSDDDQLISISNGTAAFVLDFRGVIFGNENVTNAVIDDTQVVLASAYAVKYRLLTVVFNNIHSCKDCFVARDQVIEINITVSRSNNSRIHINRQLVLNCEKLCPRPTDKVTVTPSSFSPTNKETTVNFSMYKYQEIQQNISFVPHSLIENLSIEKLEWERPIEMTHFRLLLQDGLISIDGYHRLIKELWMSNSSKRTRSINMTAFNNDLQIERLPWGFLPWEKVAETRTVLNSIPQQITTTWNGLTSFRHILDLYADSLRHSNKILSNIYFTNQRRVPAHGPHFVSTVILGESKEKFFQPWWLTSAHRFRSPNDVQFAFMYFQYLINEHSTVSIVEILDSVDSDRSRGLDENELRTLVLRISTNETIFNKNMAEIFKDTQSNCINSSMKNLSSLNITISQITSCLNWSKWYQPQQVPKYPFTIHEDTELAFIMISNNRIKVLRDLDGLRKTSKKFFCLNDNLVDGDNSHELVADIRRDVNDFLRFMFPQPSQFERNISHKNKTSWSIQSLLIGTLIMLTVIFILTKKISIFLRNFQWNSRIRNYRILF